MSESTHRPAGTRPMKRKPQGQVNLNWIKPWRRPFIGE
ncbi:hypothetical protein PSPHG_CDS_0037 [Pseudomonas phage Psxphi15]